MEQTPDLAKLSRLAKSDAGQQLLALLRSSGGDRLDSALDQASRGDYGGAMRLLSALMNNSEAQALLKQLEDIQ